MPRADCVARAGHLGLIMSNAFWGTKGSCFFGGARGGRVIPFPVNVFSSPSDHLLIELDMLQNGFITWTPNEDI